ncbi:MAG: hypothetical protein V9E84_08685 [Trichococcus flocculiformis]
MDTDAYLTEIGMNHIGVMAFAFHPTFEQKFGHTCFVLEIGRHCQIFSDRLIRVPVIIGLDDRVKIGSIRTGVRKRCLGFNGPVISRRFKRFVLCKEKQALLQTKLIQ